MLQTNKKKTFNYQQEEKVHNVKDATQNTKYQTVTKESKVTELYQQFLTLVRTLKCVYAELK